MMLKNRLNLLTRCAIVSQNIHFGESVLPASRIISITCDQEEEIHEKS